MRLENAAGISCINGVKTFVRVMAVVLKQKMSYYMIIFRMSVVRIPLSAFAIGFLF